MKNVLIVSCSKYPEGNAGAVRQHMFAKILVENGADVLVVGMGPSTDFRIQSYDGIKYVSLRKKPDNVCNKIGNRFLFIIRLKRLILNSQNKFTHILFVNSYYNFDLLWIKKYAKKTGIKLYHDSVEFYSPEEYKLGCLSSEFIKNNVMNRFLIDRQFNVIAISRYLSDYFQRKGIKTSIVPVLLDSKAIHFIDTKTGGKEKTVITYAGNPGLKDRIDTVVKAIFSMSEEDRRKIEFRIIGITKEKFSKLFSISQVLLEENKDCIRFYGRISRSEVIQNLEETDFTVLVRNQNMRYAKAGFPTKVVESLMTGTPVLCNISSDLGLYLKDMHNAVIAQGNSVEEIQIAILRILSLDKDKRHSMRLNARKTAEEYFDYRKYLNAFHDF